MVVLHLLQSYRFSGAENVACQIIEMMSEEGGYKQIYASTDGEIRKSVTDRGIEFAGLKSFSLSEVRRVIREVRPDIIYAHDMHASFKAALCMGKAKLICHIHNNNFNSRKLSFKTFLFKYAAKKASHIFWVSDTSYENFYYRDKFVGKSSVLYNIIDIEELYKKRDVDTNRYDYDVVFLGRLAAPKNPERLLKVFSEIIARRPESRLAIVGTGELERVVHEMAKSMDFNDNLFFLGYKSNPYKILSDSKVMILTSLWEGTPMCSLEAMALGVPIVSTPTDGLCRVVIDKKTGFLSDDDQELAELCCRLIDDTELHKNMSAAAISRVKELMDKDVYKEEIRKAYEEDWDNSADAERRRS